MAAAAVGPSQARHDKAAVGGLPDGIALVFGAPPVLPFPLQDPPGIGPDEPDIFLPFGIVAGAGETGDGESSVSGLDSVQADFIFPGPEVSAPIHASVVVRFDQPDITAAQGGGLDIGGSKTGGDQVTVKGQGNGVSIIIAVPTKGFTPGFLSAGIGF